MVRSRQPVIAHVQLNDRIIIWNTAMHSRFVQCSTKKVHAYITDIVWFSAQIRNYSARCFADLAVGLIVVPTVQERLHFKFA